MNTVKKSPLQPPVLLVVEDEPDIAELIKVNAKEAGYETIIATTGAEGLREVAMCSPVVVILDVMLPEMDGWEVCKRIRSGKAKHDIPILMLSARAAEDDRVKGFEVGADDYLTKPFSPRELLIRVRKLMERPPRSPESPDVIRHNGLVIDRAGHVVTFLEKPITLTRMQFDLLFALMSNKGKVLDREKLLSIAWKYENAQDIDTRTVDTTMGRLRNVLGEEAGKFIDTIRGVGYRFQE